MRCHTHPDAQTRIDDYQRVPEELNGGVDEPCLGGVEEADGDGADREEDHLGETAEDAVGFGDGLEVGGLGVGRWQSGEERD